MDDPGCDSTWDEDDDDDDDDDESPDAGPDEDGEAGAPGHADDGDEDGEAADGARAARLQAATTGARNLRALRDTRRYRHHYPDLVESGGEGDMPNLSFYRNETCFLPNGCLIEDILQHWRDDYDRLEDNHSYIQWLFPLREPGVNWHAKPLTLREVQAFKSCAEAGERLVQAYELMLGFYGIRLQDRGTGRLCRAPNYQKRFQNLNRHSHNNLRITRIVKSLGELGLERYQAPLARFFLEETLVRRQLPAVRQSALDYFVFSVRCARERRQLLRFAWRHFRPRRAFVWAPLHKLCPPPAPQASPAALPTALARVTDAPPTEPDAPPMEPEAPPTGPDAPPTGPDAPPTEPDAPPTEPDAPPTEPEAPPTGPDAPPMGPDAPPTEPEAPPMVPEAPPTPPDAPPTGHDAPPTLPDAPPTPPGAPPSPRERKKRKLEGGRPGGAPGEQGPRSSPEVETIARNLEDCALDLGRGRLGGPETGRPDPGPAEEPSPQAPGAPAATAEVRKRRKVDRGGPGPGPAASATTCAPVQPSAPSCRPEAGEEPGGPEQAPASPASAGADEAEADAADATEVTEEEAGPGSPARAGAP